MSKRLILLALLMSSVFLISSCQKLDFEHCTPNIKADRFWEQYALPNVEGAILCSDVVVPAGRRISFIHYREGEKNLFDFSELYEIELSNKGWAIKGRRSSEVALGTYVNKGDDRFYMSVEDCYSGQDIYFHRPCVSVNLAKVESGEKADRSGPSNRDVLDIKR